MIPVRSVRSAALAATLMVCSLAPASQAGASSSWAPRADQARIRAIHNECRTWRCVRRVQQARRQRVRRHVRATIAPYTGWLRAVRWCESTNNYRINTGNGFYGAYQFTLSSWAAVGGRGYPHLAPPLWQDYRAVRLLHLQGRGAWPNCG